MIVTDQKISETTPKMVSVDTATGCGSPGLKTVWTVYSGLVPMSPKTTPRAPTARAPWAVARRLMPPVFAFHLAKPGAPPSRTTEPSRKGQRDAGPHVAGISARKVQRDAPGAGVTPLAIGLRWRHSQIRCRGWRLAGQIAGFPPLAG